MPAACERLIENLPRRSDERAALEVLAVSRLLADQHHRRVRGPFAEHGLGRVAPQRAAPASLPPAARSASGRQLGVGQRHLAIASPPQTADTTYAAASSVPRTPPSRVGRGAAPATVARCDVQHCCNATIPVCAWEITRLTSRSAGRAGRSSGAAARPTLRRRSRSMSAITRSAGGCRCACFHRPRRGGRCRVRSGHRAVQAAARREPAPADQARRRLLRGRERRLPPDAGGGRRDQGR